MKLRFAGILCVATLSLILATSAVWASNPAQGKSYGCQANPSLCATAQPTAAAAPAQLPATGAAAGSHGNSTPPVVDLALGVVALALVLLGAYRLRRQGVLT